jgi:hypothetical protein
LSELERSNNKQSISPSSGAPVDFDALWGATDQTRAAPPKQNSERYSIGDDGLLVENVGPWVKDKHGYVSRFAHASGAARRKYRNSAFIELFSGPGRARIRNNGEYVDGSAITAFKAGLGSCKAFSSIEVSDLRDDLVDAARQRLLRLGACHRGDHAGAWLRRNYR